MSNPSAVIFINKDMNDISKNTIKKQLNITEDISKQEFDSRLSSSPDYVNIIHSNYIRILVILDSFQDYINRDKADLVLFFKTGMISVEGGNFGPPKLTLDIHRVNLYDLLRYNNSSHVKILPAPVSQPCACINTCNCGLGGIFAIESRDISGITCPNTDNLSHNTDFINRK